MPSEENEPSPERTGDRANLFLGLNGLKASWLPLLFGTGEGEGDAGGGERRSFAFGENGFSPVSSMTFCIDQVDEKGIFKLRLGVQTNYYRLAKEAIALHYTFRYFNYSYIIFLQHTQEHANNTLNKKI